MNRPDNMPVYDELDLKLGIKSSLPNVKSTIALAILLWESSNRQAELIYSKQHNDGIVLTDELEQSVIDYLSEVCEEEQIELDDLVRKIEDNQLFKSQMEALIVAFELVWKLAKVRFVEDRKPASAERKGGTRYPKKLLFSINVDIVNCLIESNRNGYKRVLMSWVGFSINADSECEKRLSELLMYLSESAVFKLTDGTKDVIFNQNSIYRKLLDTNETVDINGDKEAKGSLRILKSLLSDGMNTFLKYSAGNVTIAHGKKDALMAYQNRVDTFLRLSATKVVGLEDLDAENKGITPELCEEYRLSTGENVLLYGVPGAGKSWTIQHEYCNDEDCMERLVFHPDYMYSDFVGQILPVVKDDKVRYEFVPGPFVKLLKKAYWNPTKSYFLIIEEINRGNAPAIFGEIFQLLDRKDKFSDGFSKGTSEYGITNANIAREVYDDENIKVRIPGNMSIIGTMNTSDQNVFTLDTAFQRRWIMRMIPNAFGESHEFARTTILDTRVSWQQFCEAINDEILRRNNITSSEDKRLGAYFISAEDLDLKPIPDNVSDMEKKKIQHHNSRFAEKVLKYLWDDAFKFSHPDTFDTRTYKSLEMVIEGFNSATGNNRFRVFQENLRNLITNGVDQQNANAVDDDNEAEER